MQQFLGANSTANHHSARRWWKALFAIAVLSMVAIAINGRILRNGIIFETDDLHIHLKWLQHFYKHLSEGTWYPRWLAGLNYGYGSPTFVFYPPAVAYLGAALKAIGFGTERAMAVLMVIASFMAGIGFYLWGLCRWRAFSALAGAVAYMSAPYLIYNTYSRGALSEVLATSLLPFGLFLTDKVLRTRTLPYGRGWISLVLCFSLLSLTHLPSLLLYAIAWPIYVICHRLPFKELVRLGMAPLIGFGLSGFYLVPALLEKKLVNLDSMRGVAGGFKAQLIPLVGSHEQLSAHVLSIFWHGWGSAIICLSIATFLGTSKSVWCRRCLIWLLLLCILSFSMSSLSYRLWAISPTLQMVQFPWRLMGLFSLVNAGTFSLAIESIMASERKRKKDIRKKILAAGLLICLAGWNLSYAKELSLRYAGFYVPGDVTETQPNNSRKAYAFEVVSLALNDPYSNQLKDVVEYLPRHPSKKGLVPPPLKAQPLVNVKTGEAVIEVEEWKGDRRRLLATVSEPTEFHLRTYYYPAWQAYANDVAIPISPTDDGLIGVALRPGTYRLDFRYHATFAMKLGRSISGLSLLLLLCLRKFGNKRML